MYNLLTIAITYAQNERIHLLSTNIQNASLYFDGAIIGIRTADFEINSEDTVHFFISDIHAASNKTEFNVLPSEGIEILDIDIDLDSNSYKKNASYKNIQKTISSLKDSIQSIKSQISILKKIDEILYKNQTIRVSDKSIYVDDLNELIGFYAKKYEELDDKSVELNAYLNQTENQLAQQTEKIARIIDSLAYPLYSLKILALAKQNSTAHFNIYYPTSNICWTPYYNIHYSDETEMSNMQLWAKVESKGIIFNNVMVQYHASKLNSENDYFINSNNIQLSLNSSNAFKNQIVTEYKIPSKVIYTCNPSVSANVNANLELIDVDGLKFVKAKARIFLKDAYLGIFSLEKKNQIGKFDIDLGYIRWIQIEKKLVLDKTKKSILNGSIRQDIAYNLIINNLYHLPIELKINEEIPFFSNQKIEVECNLPKSAIKLENQDAFEVNVKLEPLNKNILSYQYKITYPQGISVEDYYLN